MPVSKKHVLVAAAIAGLMASSNAAMAGSAFPGHDSMKKMCSDTNSCKGAAACKGQNACKGSGHSCGGKNGCPGK